MTLDSSKVPPESYFEEQAALQLLVPRAKVLAALADALGTAPTGDTVTIPRAPTAALLRPFISCPEAELPEAWEAMLRIAATMAGRAVPPAAPGEIVKAIREYLGVHPDLQLGGQVLDSMALELSRIALDYPADLIGALALEELMQLGYTVEAGAILPPRDLPEQACEFFGVRPVAGPSAGMTWWNNASEAERAHWSAAAGNTGVPADAYAAFLRHTAAPALEAPAAPGTPPLTPDEARWAARSAENMSGPSDATSGTEYAMAGAMALAKKLAAAPQAPIAHRMLRKNGAGEWVHDTKTWACGPAPAELIADASKHPNLYRIEHAYFSAAPQTPAAPSAGNWIAADDVARLVRDLDVALHGEADAAPQASLCDIVGLAKAAAGKLGRPVLAAPAVDASDTALLDAMERHRIAVVPEHEGPWDAELYEEGEEPQHVGSGATPREALRAALAGQAKKGGAQ